MDYRRSAPANQRRRRVLLEETEGVADESTEPAVTRRSRSAARSGRTYSESALAENQPRVTDLIPLRRWVQLLALSILVVLIIVLGLVHAYSESWAAELDADAAALINPQSPGSLSRWLSSAMLGWAGILSLVIFSMRRHKTDDFHARYRVWISAALILFMASMDVSTGFHHLAFDAVRIGIRRVLPDSALVAQTHGLCWALVSLLATLCLTRLAIEVRPSRAALLATLAASIAYGAAGLSHIGWLPLQSPRYGVLITASCRLAAEVFLLATIMIFGRHVYLDAQGLLQISGVARRRARTSRAGKSADATDSTEAGEKRAADEGHPKTDSSAVSAGAAVASRRSDLDDQPTKTTRSPASVGGQPAAASSERAGLSRKPVLQLKSTNNAIARPNPPPPAATDSGDQDDDSDADSGGLTRAERRRLKKLAKRDDRKVA
jgi:hypothetical protein